MWVQKLSLSRSINPSTMALGRLAVLLLLASAASAAQTLCTGDLRGTHVDVVVNGTACTVNSATIQGNIEVIYGGTLTLQGDTIVEGNVEADSAGDVTITAGSVLGSITVVVMVYWHHFA